MTRSISLSLIALTLTVGCGVAPSGQDTSSEGSSGGVYAPLSDDDGSSSSGSDDTDVDDTDDTDADSGADDTGTTGDDTATTDSGGTTDDVTICAVTSNGEWFSVAVENLSTGDQTHWFASDGTVPSPLFVVDSDTDTWCAEYPGASSTDKLKISGLSTTVYGYGDFIVYSCGGLDGDAVFYDGDTTCATVTFTVNGDPVTTAATDSYDYQYN